MSVYSELKRRNVFRVAVGYGVLSWLLLQIADVLMDTIGLPDIWGKAVLGLLLIGIFPVLIFSWVYEITPEGVKRESELSAETSITAHTAKRLNIAVIVLLVIAIGVFAIDRFLGSPVNAVAPVATTAPPPDAIPVDTTTDSTDDESLLAIAVLPFESFTEGREDQYFADGLADTLLHKLAQLETLTVIARNSSFQFKGQNVDVREIGAKLGVPTIIEGSVQRQGNRIRVIAQLVSTKDGAHWWSGTFDGTFDDVFALQDEIAAAIAEQLQITLSDRDRDRMLRSGTANPAAYETLVRARAIETDYDAVGFDVDTDPKMILLREVVTIDPNYALGWAYLSDYYGSLAFHGVDDGQFDEFVAASRAAAEEAIEVDPQEEAGYVALGFANWRGRNVVAAEANYRKALSMNPNNDGALAGLGLVVIQRDPEEAYRLFSRTQQIDPNNKIVYRQLFFALSGMGRLAEGIDKLKEGIQQHPDFIILYEDLAASYADSFAQHAEAARIISDVIRRNPNSRMGLFSMAEHWYAVNDIPRANAWLNVLLEKHPDDSRGMKLKVLLLQLDGDIDDAMAVANLLPRDGIGGFTREIPMVMLCMTKQNSACARKSIDNMNAFYSTFKRQGGRESMVIDYHLNLINGSVNLPDAETATSKLESTERGLSSRPFLYDGRADDVRRGYLRATALIMLDRIDEAMVELELTLSIADGGFVESDIFGLLPENSLLLEPLRVEPGYDDWLARFTARRTAMRETMITMEAAGEISRAP